MEAGRQKLVKLVIVFVLAGILVVLSIGEMTVRSKESSQFMGTMIMVMMVILICFVVDACWRNSYTSGGSRSSDTSSFVNAEEVAASDSAASIQPPEYESPPSYEDMVAAGQLELPPGIDKITANEGPVFESARNDSENVSRSDEVQISVEGLPSYEEVVTAAGREYAVYINHHNNTENQNLILFI